MKRACLIWYLMCFLRNRINFHFSERQIILSGVKENVLCFKQHTYFTVHSTPLAKKKNAQVMPMRKCIKIHRGTWHSKQIFYPNLTKQKL